MQTRAGNPIKMVIAGLMVLGYMGTAMITTPLSAQDVRYQCVDEPALAFFDANADGVLSLSELKDVAARFPENQGLQNIINDMTAGSFSGVQYDGSCEGVARDGVSVVGEDGESATGEDGESVIGGDGESVVIRGGTGQGGQAGEDGQSVAGEDGESVVGEDGESVVGSDGQSTVGIVCAPNPRLALAEGNDDGIVSMDEIDNIIELVGGNVDLEAVRDRAVEAGITGLQYRDCDPGTPVASPVVATPVATPSISTPVAFSSQTMADDDEERTSKGNAGLIIAGAGGATFLAGTVIFRSTRRT